MLFQFATRLKELRLKKGYTQKKVAERISREGVSVSKNSLAKYEVGRTYPNLEVAAALADFYDVSLDYLAMGDKSKVATLNDLNDEQIDLINEIIQVLKQHNRLDISSRTMPTAHQRELIFRLIEQFLK